MGWDELFAPSSSIEDNTWEHTPQNLVLLLGATADYLFLIKKKTKKRK